MSPTPEPSSAIAELHFEQSWNLTSAGTANPLRYWSHVHFEGDPKWGQELWTLFVEIENPPEQDRRVYLVRVFFLAPNAPTHFLRIGQRFDLCVGPIVKARGVIKTAPQA